MTIPILHLQHDVAIGKFNTFGIDARACLYAEIDDVALLQQVRQDATLAMLPRLILGGGSNIVLSDVIGGLVLKIALTGKALVGENASHFYVRAQAGESWHQFVLWTLENGFAGLENLSLIPGTVGAAPIQNIGAYGVEIKDYLHQLTYFDWQTGETRTLDKAGCAFAYRDSIFKHALKDRAVIIDVTFALPRVWHAQLAYADVARYLETNQISNPTASDISKAIIAIRQSKLPDPAVIGNAGSFFKNPIVQNSERDRLHALYPQLVSYPQERDHSKLAAGWLIEQCGWKGKSLGRAGVYEKQALVLVNLGGATGAEVKQLAARIQTDVFEKFGISLEAEPGFI